MNALRAPLTALPTQRKKCVYFLLDMADDFIDGFASPNRRAAAFREAPQVDSGGPARVWAWLSHIWSEWRSALAIVQPEIVLAGTARAFVSSGHGRFGEAGREDPRLSTKSAT